MAKAGKPKNDGQLLVVRIPTEVHAAIAQIQSGYITHVEMRAGAVTKGFVVTEAILALRERVSQLMLMKSGVPMLEAEVGGSPPNMLEMEIDRVEYAQAPSAQTWPEGKA